MKWLLFFIPLSIICNACNNLPPKNFTSLIDKQPFVVKSIPLSESVLEDPAQIEIQFSERIDIASLGPNSVTLVSEITDQDLLQQPKELTMALKAKLLNIIPLQYNLDGDETHLTLFPQQLEPGIYQLIITSELMATSGIPFNQSPGENFTPFVATYFYQVDAQAHLDPNIEDPTETWGPIPGILMIHEFLYDGIQNETNGESFVELYGTPYADISLYEILLINGTNGEITDRITLPQGSIIPEDSLWVVADLQTGSLDASMVERWDLLDNFDPQNGPDAVQLLDRGGHLMDSLAYGEGGVEISELGSALAEGSVAVDVSAGHSLSRSNGIDTQNNAADFFDLDHPTPGIL